MKILGRHGVVVVLFAALCFVAKTFSAEVSPSPAESPSTISLDSWIASSSLWQTSSMQFPEGRSLGFRWVSDAHDAARASSRALRLRDLSLAEVIARFASATPSVSNSTGGSNQLAEVQVSIYNRGDSGNLGKVQFDALVERSKTALNSLTGVAPLERGTDYGSAVQSRGLVWATPASRFLLEWSDTPENHAQGVDYRAEFIRLRVTPQRDQARSLLDQARVQSALTAGASQPKTVRAADLPARVVKEADGGELLPNIPMVDQGRKGYCVTAATERILRYYGVEVDQNELAQIANADAHQGTSPEEMLDALKKLASRFRVLVITEYRLTYSDYIRTINDYNRVARSAPQAAGASVIPPQRTIASYPEVCHQMKGDLLVEAKTTLNPASMTTFEREVKAHIERGIPLLWSVQLGIVPEEKLNPQAHGGHMRLIVGFNPKTREIYYSDTWGHGHELKKMPLANAWTITDGVFTLEPS